MLKVNKASQIIHDEERAEERCNLDDAGDNIQKLLYSDIPLLFNEGYRFCKWCFPHDR
jgi:hypothetical protein